MDQKLAFLRPKANHDLENLSETLKKKKHTHSMTIKSGKMMSLESGRSGIRAALSYILCVTRGAQSLASPGLSFPTSKQVAITAASS